MQRRADFRLRYPLPTMPIPRHSRGMQILFLDDHPVLREGLSAPGHDLGRSSQRERRTWRRRR